MKKFIASIIVTVATIMTLNNAYAQDGGFSPEVILDTHNTCSTYVSSWYQDEYGIWTQDQEAFDSEIWVDTMPGSFLYNVEVTFSYHFHQAYQGDMSFFMMTYAESMVDPLNDKLDTAEQIVAVNVQAEEEVTVTLRGDFKVIGVWDLVPGEYRAAYFYVVVGNIDLNNNPVGFMRVDVVKTVRYDYGAPCWAN